FSYATSMPHRSPLSLHDALPISGFKSGYLRKNGVPYSENASITEYFDLLRQPDGTEWLVVKTIVEDPEYLAEPYITSSNFRKEQGRDGWNPTECVAD